MSALMAALACALPSPADVLGRATDTETPTSGCAAPQEVQVACGALQPGAWDVTITHARGVEREAWQLEVTCGAGVAAVAEDVGAGRWSGLPWRWDGSVWYACDETYADAGAFREHVERHGSLATYTPTHLAGALYVTEVFEDGDLDAFERATGADDGTFTYTWEVEGTWLRGE